MVAAMADLEMIELYLSPWSERLRWVLELKRVPYRRTEYVPVSGEKEHERRTGIPTAPVLIADGDVVGDSDRAVEWVEARYPTPALLPTDPRRRMQVRAWEHLGTEVIAPFGRLLTIGRLKARDIQPLADRFAEKYHWSQSAEARAEAVLRTLLIDLAGGVEQSQYLVGDTFSRADLTVATMISPLIGFPPEELFSLDAGMRTVFGVSFAQELVALRTWRDETYRRHRGGQVTPAA